MRQILRTIAEQLETERMLGGRWIPAGRIEVPGDAPAAIVTGGNSEIQQEQSMAKTPEKKQRQTDKRKKLDAIAKKVATCVKCPLHTSRTHPVPGEGNPDAKIVFVGEAPGESEDLSGRPFVGRAGQLLTKIIEAMGLKREDVFICNILKCRPPENRDPQATEIAACIDYLYEQLDVIQPEIIVALGAHAARTLLASHAAIGDLRGRVLNYQSSPLSAPIKLVATYHPAYLLRNYSEENRRRVWNDMQIVLREVGLPVPGQETKRSFS